MADVSALRFEPLDGERWGDLERLFGPRGAYGGCWCMWWRLKRTDFEAGCKGANRSAFRALVRGGARPGLLAYDGDEPVGWVAIAPREEHAALERSRVLARIDERPVWSITCLFVARAHRGRGLTRRLVRAALDRVRASGGGLVEAYPTDPRGRVLAPVSSFMGLPGVYAAEGFREVARPSASKVVMRRGVRPARGTRPNRRP